MKKILAIAILLVTVLVNAGAKEKSLKYDCGDIVSIKQGSSYSVSFEFHITKGRSKSVEVVYDSELEEQIRDFELDVNFSEADRRLYVGIKELPRRFGRIKLPLKPMPVKVYLEMDEISSIDLSAASSAYFDGSFLSSDLEIELSGAANFVTPLKVDGKSLSLDCSGASNVSVYGDFDEVSIDASGASYIDYRGNSKNIDGDFSGASKLYLQGDSRNSEIECSGASNMKIKGSCEKVDLEASGACKIDAKDYCVKSAVIELSGASIAKITVIDELRHDVSPASKLTYYGNPRMTNISEIRNVIQGGM